MGLEGSRHASDGLVPLGTLLKDQGLGGICCGTGIGIFSTWGEC